MKIQMFKFCTDIEEFIIADTINDFMWGKDVVDVKITRFNGGDYDFILITVMYRE